MAPLARARGSARFDGVASGCCKCACAVPFHPSSSKRSTVVNGELAELTNEGVQDARFGWRDTTTTFVVHDLASEREGLPIVFELFGRFGIPGLPVALRAPWGFAEFRKGALSPMVMMNYDLILFPYSDPTITGLRGLNSNHSHSSSQIHHVL
jgi:hypothetical protein